MRFLYHGQLQVAELRKSVEMYGSSRVFDKFLLLIRLSLRPFWVQSRANGVGIPLLLLDDYKVHLIEKGPSMPLAEKHWDILYRGHMAAKAHNPDCYHFLEPLKPDRFGYATAHVSFFPAQFFDPLTLAVPYCYGVISEADILRAEAQAFGDSEATPI